MEGYGHGSVLLAFSGAREAGSMAETARAAGFSVAGTVGSAEEAIAFLSRFETDFVFASVLLKGLQADGLEGDIRKIARYRRSAVLYFVPGCAGRLMREAYAPSVIMPVDEKTLLNEAMKLVPLPVRRGDEETALRILSEMGFCDHPARRYLAYACALCANDSRYARRLRALVYPEVAKAFEISEAGAADGMRRLIDKAFLSGNIDYQYALFLNTIDETRGKPTVSQLIALVGEIIRRGTEA